MTRNEIIRMAREAGMSSLSLIDIGYLEKFAALVAAAEHKACLEIADLCADADMHASMAANAIRARSQA